MDPVLSRDGAEPVKFEGEGSELIIDETKLFIEQSLNDDKPFLAVVWFGSPHEPYSGLDKDLSLYDDLPELYNNQTVRLTSNETGTRTERPLGDVLRERYAEITAMDRAIGDLRDFLESKGIRNETMLLYCGDNGTPASAARTGMTLKGQKGTMYEGGIKVPGIIEWPGAVVAGSSTDFAAVTSDLLPTLCDVTNLPVPDRTLDGVSLVSAMKGEDKMRNEPLYFWSFDFRNVYPAEGEHYIDPALQEGTTPLVKKMGDKYTRTFRNYRYPEVDQKHTGGERVIMDGKYKLILGSNPEGQMPELFDIQKDPGEQLNLASNLPEVVQSMQLKLKDWQLSVLHSLHEEDYQ